MPPKEPDIDVTDIKKSTALKLPEFRLFTLARFLITLGTQAQAVLVGWQIYELTKDPLSLGLIGLSEAFPAIFVALYAGHLTDISVRKKIVLAAASLLTICSLLLFIVSSQIANSGSLVYAIYGIIFISGIARGFLAPGQFAFLAEIVPKNLLANAITYNTASWQIGAVAGPAIGGLMFVVFSFSYSYLIIFFLCLSGVFMYFRIKQRPVPEISAHSGIYERLTAGIKYVYTKKVMLGAMSLDLFAVLFGGAVALLPIFAAEILYTGAAGLGILRAAPSAGAVVMALILSKYNVTNNAGKNLFASVIMFGVCIIIFALSRNFYLSFAALAFSGFFDAVSVVIRSSIMQLMTPDNMKGRVSAVNSIFIGSSNEIGAFESGAAAKLLGVIPSVIFGGSMTILITSAVAVFNKSLRKLKLT